MTEQVIIITGGGTGIGQAAAIQFAQADAWVVIVGRRSDPLTTTAQLSDRIHPITADILQPEDLDRVIRVVTERWGRLDCLVNNAGMFVQQSLAAMDAPRANLLFATNVLAPSLLSQAALPLLKESHGSIINISSTFGHKAAPLISQYAASKAALEQLTRCWALELAPLHIRVNAIAPGPTETGILQGSGLAAEDVERIQQQEREQVPLGRRGNAAEIATWIVNLAHPGGSWITGQILSIDGGLSLT